MSDLSMKSLFAAAREDAPDDATHDAMWNNVANATGMAAGATVAAAATTAAKPAAATAAVASLGPKLIAVGLLIGAVSAAVGGVVALGWMESQTGVAPETQSTSAPAARTVHVPARGAQLGDATPRARDSQPDRVEPSAAKNVAPAAVAVGPSSAPNAVSATSDLAEEARLVTEARSALVGGEPDRALTLLRKTHRFANRALEPEELSLEARALRALGRVDEAAATELKLKARFPSHALAR